MRQTFKYFQLGVETAMETIISFPGRVFCILRLQYLQNERDTDSLILGPKDSLENTYVGITVENHSIFGTQDEAATIHLKCVGLKVTLGFKLIYVEGGAQPRIWKISKCQLWWL